METAGESVVKVAEGNCWVLKYFGRKQERIHGAYKVYRSERLNCLSESVVMIILEFCLLQSRLKSNGSTFLLHLESLFDCWGRASVTSRRW